MVICLKLILLSVLLLSSLILCLQLTWTLLLYFFCCSFVNIKTWKCNHVCYQRWVVTQALHPTESLSLLISRKLPTFYFFCLYFSGFCFFFFFFFKLRGLSNKSSSNRIQCCLCFLIIYCTFIFCITILFSAYFSDMNYFVYFICLLCSTSLTTTMLDSYDVSETLNDFIKALGSLCSLDLTVYWVLNQCIPMTCYLSISLQ